MTSATNLFLCLNCYVRCPKDPLGRCTHCGAMRARKGAISPAKGAPPSARDAGQRAFVGATHAPLDAR
jgi:hypothetical protein